MVRLSDSLPRFTVKPSVIPVSHTNTTDRKDTMTNRFENLLVHKKS